MDKQDNVGARLGDALGHLLCSRDLMHDLAAEVLL